MAKTRKYRVSKLTRRATEVIDDSLRHSDLMDDLVIGVTYIEADDLATLESVAQELRDQEILIDTYSEASEQMIEESYRQAEKARKRWATKIEASVRWFRLAFELS